MTYFLADRSGAAFTNLGERLAPQGVIADVLSWAVPPWPLPRSLARHARLQCNVPSPRHRPGRVSLTEERGTSQTTSSGCRPWWLNKQAPVYISARTISASAASIDHPGLRVMAALPQHIFAMKVLAARTRDLWLLADIIAIESLSQALQIWPSRLLPGRTCSPRSAAVLGDSSAERACSGRVSREPNGEPTSPGKR